MNIEVVASFITVKQPPELGDQMDFHTGEFIEIKERHYNHHGILMLQGQGAFVIDEDFMPVSACDVVWMSLFCNQCFSATGKEESRYTLPIQGHYNRSTAED